MKKKSIVASKALALALVIVYFQSSDRPIPLIANAYAVVGRPLTPVSVAGVARRTTRRTIAMTSMYVAALPPACTVVVIEGTSLHQCGGTYYQASGNQYVVVNVN